MNWQSPPSSSKAQPPPRKKPNARKSVNNESSDSELAEIKRKPAKKAVGDKPSTSEAARAAILARLNGNSFALLSDDDDVDGEDTDEEMEDILKALKKKNEKPQKAPKVIKPPPIFIPDVTNIKCLSTAISNALGKEAEITYKASSNNTIRVMTPDKDNFTKLKNFLNENNKRFHTFQPRDERAYRIVIKGLHYSTELEDIKEGLSRHGHNVRDVHNPTQKGTKKPLNLFFANLEPAKNNKEAFQVKRLCSSVVTVEPPLKFNDVPQCYRCQAFGHTKRYCQLEHRCVKCGGEHPTAECSKDASEPAHCLHCDGPHTASYKGCPAYKRAKSAFAPKPTAPRSQQPNPSRIDPNISYASVAKNAAPQTEVSPNPNHGLSGNPLDAVMARMESMFERMMEKVISQMTQMMATLCNSLCKRV